MAISPGSIANLRPPRPDDFARKARDLARTTRENAVARVAQATQIGAGGLLVNNGGSITVTGGGAITLPTGTLSANNVVAASQLSGATLQTTGDAVLGGSLYSPVGRATPVVTGYVAAYLDSVGRLGATPSSIRFKQDVTPAQTDALVDALLQLALVRFRYTSAVEEYGDDAPTELGAIAEYAEAVGLGEYVFRDADGEIMGINYERLTIPLIAAVQSLDARLKALEETV